MKNLENQTAPTLTVCDVDRIIDQVGQTFKPYHLFHQYFSNLPENEIFQYGSIVANISEYDVLEDTNAFIDTMAQLDRRESFHQLMDELDTMDNLVSCCEKRIQDTLQAEVLFMEYHALRLFEVFHKRTSNISILDQLYTNTIRQLNSTNYIN